MAVTYTDAAISMTNGTNTVVVRPRTLAKNVYLETAVGDSAVGSTLTSALTKIDTAIDNVKKDVSDGMNSVGTAITAKGSSVPTNPTFSDLVTGVNNINAISPYTKTVTLYNHASIDDGSLIKWSTYNWVNGTISGLASILGYNYDSTTGYFYLEDGLTSAQLNTIGNGNLKVYYYDEEAADILCIESATGTMNIPSSTDETSLIYYIKTDDYCIFTSNANMNNDNYNNPPMVFCYIVGNDGRYYKNYNYGNYIAYTDISSLTEHSYSYGLLSDGGFYGSDSSSGLMLALNYEKEYINDHLYVSSPMSYNQIPNLIHVLNSVTFDSNGSNDMYFIEIGRIKHPDLINEYRDDSTYRSVTECAIPDDYCPILLKVDNIKTSFLRQFSIAEFSSGYTYSILDGSETT